MEPRTKAETDGPQSEPIPRQLSAADKDEHRWDEGRRIPDTEKLPNAV